MKNTKVITCSNLKGGTGKTMVTFNIGGYLLSKGKRVLFIDADTQSNLTKHIGFNAEILANKGFEYKTIIDVLKEGTPAKEAILRIPLRDGETIVDFIPSALNLVVADYDLIAEKNNKKNHYLLKNWIKDNEDYLSKYDYIFFDVGPYPSMSTFNALFASDDVYLITHPGISPHDGLKSIYNIVDANSRAIGVENNIRGIIVNKYNKRNSTVAESYKDFIDDSESTPEGLKIFNSFIHESIIFQKAELIREPIALSKDWSVVNSPGYKSFMDLMEELEEKSLI